MDERERLVNGQPVRKKRISAVMRGPRAHCPGAAGGLAAGAVVAGREAELEAGARWVGTTAERPQAAR